MTWTLIWLAVASAQTAQTDVLARAAAVWSAQAGRVPMAREQAAQRATRRSGIGPSSLFVGSQVGESTQRQLEVGVEQPLDLGLSRHRVS